jgi:transcriptional regulator with XRE-family HTH domain
MSKSYVNSNKLVELGGEIKSRRESKGWTRETLAEKLGCDPKSVQRWETGGVKLNVGNIIALKKVLGFTEVEIRYYRSEQFSAQLRTKSFGEYIADGQLNELEIKTSEIADQYPIPHLEGNDYGTKDKWLQIFGNSPDTGIVILNHQELILGYWLFVFVSSSTYENGLAGRNINRDIAIEDLIVPILPGEYDVYFVDLFTRDGYESPALSRALLNSFTQKLVEYARYGIFIKRMCANLSSEKIFSPAKQFGFEFVATHQEHKMVLRDGSIVPTRIGELVLDGNVSCPIFKYESQLKDLYLVRLPAT